MRKELPKFKTHKSIEKIIINKLYVHKEIKLKKNERKN